ncbi:MAG: hypothetical protein K1000chlam4_00095 [Chlamydiae bacterium]|nr:hypothetical protein [Chlamydiota bacterium]
MDTDKKNAKKRRESDANLLSAFICTNLRPSAVLSTFQFRNKKPEIYANGYR